MNAIGDSNYWEREALRFDKERKSRMIDAVYEGLNKFWKQPVKEHIENQGGLKRFRPDSRWMDELFYGYVYNDDYWLVARLSFLGCINVSQFKHSRLEIMLVRKSDHKSLFVHKPEYLYDYQKRFDEHWNGYVEVSYFEAIDHKDIIIDD